MINLHRWVYKEGDDPNTWPTINLIIFHKSISLNFLFAFFHDVIDLTHFYHDLLSYFNYYKKEYSLRSLSGLEMRLNKYVTVTS